GRPPAGWTALLRVRGSRDVQMPVRGDPGPVPGGAREAHGEPAARGDAAARRRRRVGRLEHLGAVALVLSAGRAEDAGARIAATLVVELLYTVWFLSRFLLVGLISAIRRALVLTAEFDAILAQGSITPQQFAVEPAVLAPLFHALAVSLILCIAAA